MAAAAGTMTATSAMVRTVYRDLLHIVKQQPPQSHTQRSVHFSELRSSFRRPLTDAETVELRLEQAHKRLSFLRISSVKVKRRGSTSSQGQGQLTLGSGDGGRQRWIYRNGERLEADLATGTLRTASGRVVSSFDGTNLDPESVSRHKKSLRRAGFVNNTHAKGLF
jgi:hypothetical protein